MKKVLALVLAVIMVCTMAMAVDVSIVTTETENTPTVTYNGLRVATPGNVIYFTLGELGFTGNNVYKDKDGNFVPEKNYVEVTFAKGADLVASKGWVKAKVGTSTTAEYIYAITLKNNDTAVVDGVDDIIISKVVAKMYGKKEAINTFNLAKTWTAAGDLKGKVAYAIEMGGNSDLTSVADDFSNAYFLSNAASDAKFLTVFDYGWTKGADIVAGTEGVLGVAGTVSTIVKDTADKTKTAAKYVKAVTSGVLEDEMKIGEKVLFNNVPAYALAKKVTDEASDKDVTLTEIVDKNVVVPNTVVTISLDGQDEGTKLYMVNADGSLKDLGAKFDANGVLVATAKITGPVYTADGALTATAAGTTGTTTNPGTGANDVVGVAAALAVVALVSGAAISLKK